MPINIPSYQYHIFITVITFNDFNKNAFTTFMLSFWPSVHSYQSSLLLFTAAISLKSYQKSKTDFLKIASLVFYISSTLVELWLFTLPLLWNRWFCCGVQCLLLIFVNVSLDIAVLPADRSSCSTGIELDTWFSGKWWTQGWQTFQGMSLLSVDQQIGRVLSFSVLLSHREEEDDYRVCKFPSECSEKIRITFRIC